MAQFDRIYQYKSMFRRDLDKMRDVYNYHIDYDRFENAYKLVNLDNTYELPGLMFTHKELLALLTIQNMITELEPGLLGPRLLPLKERLSEILETEGIDSEALSKRVKAVHAGKRRLELKCFQLVAQGTIERKRLHIEHYNRSRNEHTHRDISPQQLVHYRDNWYVDAWCHTREKILNFSVDVITECKVLDMAAKEVSQKDIKQAMQSGYGIFGGEAKNWAKLKFTPERARWVKAEMWHPKQTTTLHKDGSYTLEIPYSDDRELLGDILLFGPDVEVVGPKLLRDKLVEAVNKTAKIYKGT